MIFKHARLFLGDRFETLDLEIQENRIAAIGPDLGPGEDCSGCWLLPGLVDIHTHGCGGYDFDHAGEDQLAAMSRCYASHGTTTVLATLMTNPRPVMEQAAARCGKAQGVIKGIYLEGPFFGPEKKGAHREDCLMPVDPAFFDRLDRAAGGNIRVIAIDPCLPGALEFIREHAKTKRISLAHTPAEYAQAQEAFSAGASQVTHLYNAMTGLRHREPGLVGAALSGDCLAEVICDGVHIHPAVLKASFAALGDRGLIISDSMAACGLSDGAYSLGGQQVTVRGRRATLADGTLAGSVTFCWDGMVNLISAGIPPQQAAAAATWIPAKSAGLETVCGALCPGRQADLVLANPDWTIRQVYLAGQPV